MSRSVSNLLIVLAMAIVTTAVLALTANSTRDADSSDGRADAERGESADAALDEGSGTFGDQAADALKGGAEAVEAPLDPPSYLDPGPADTNSAVDVGAAVLGPSVAQETSSTSTLADTGPIETAEWIIIAAAAMATGGLARNAGRDHADGALTLFP